MKWNVATSYAGIISPSSSYSHRYIYTNITRQIQELDSDFGCYSERTCYIIYHLNRWHNLAVNLHGWNKQTLLCMYMMMLHNTRKPSTFYSAKYLFKACSGLIDISGTVRELWLTRWHEWTHQWSPPLTVWSKWNMRGEKGLQSRQHNCVSGMTLLLSRGSVFALTVWA